MSDSPRPNVPIPANETGLSAFQWRIFALCFALVLLDGFDTGAIGYVAPSLLTEWRVARPALAPVLSAALFGLAAGALFAGPLADRIGRKRVLVASATLFGAASLLAAFTSSLGQLTLARFVTGLGLGAAMPNAVTLMSEYCPEARRAALTNTMFCSFPIGLSFGGMVAAWLIPHWGWRSVFLCGGVAPLALAALSAAVLPESVRYLLARGISDARLQTILKQVGSWPENSPPVVHAETTPATPRAGLGLILSRPYILGSVMLWTAYFMGLVIIYALVNWMPILLRDTGLDAQTATLVAALFPLGGLGAVLTGWLMDRGNADRIIAGAYALTALALFLLGRSTGNLAALILTVALAGTLVNTGQTSLPALAATFYPTQGRATGVAWMMGIGRFGGIFGSFLVAELSRRQLDFSAIFSVVAVPGLIASLAVLSKSAARREQPSSVRVA